MSRIISEHAIIKENVFIGENVVLEEGVYIDYGAIIRENVLIKKGSYVGCNCIIGEYLRDFFASPPEKAIHPLEIGENSIIRSGTIIYGGCKVGDFFQTGHRATIRENCYLGNHVRVGTSTDIQHSCFIGNYVNMHSNVFMGEKTIIEDFVWIFPGVTITNDPTPPSNILKPVTIKEYAVIGARAVLLPGIEIGSNSLIGAGTIVTKSVLEEQVVLGNPGKVVENIRNIKNKETGENAYPWPEYFDRGMPWADVKKS